MNEYDLKPNSHKYKEEMKAQAEERHIEKVVDGAVKTKKRSGVHKFTDVFVAEDINSVVSNITNDVIIPSFKKVIFDAITSGFDMFLFGGTARSSNMRSGGSKVSYRNYYDRREDERRSYAKPRFDFDDIVFETRGAAEVVLDEMVATIERYGIVTVSDMYEMAGLRQPYTSNKFGWTSIRSADVSRVRDGYIIKLPKAAAID